MDPNKPKHEPDVYAINAQHGQNRAGVELDGDDSFEAHEARDAIDDTQADARERDEGAEIRARVHTTGNDVLKQP